MCVSCNWKTAVEWCDRILEDVENMPSRAEEFGESVSEKVSLIQEWVEENEHITDGQRDALERMEASVRRWLDRRRDD
jgi:hypothetical protein